MAFFTIAFLWLFGLFLVGVSFSILFLFIVTVLMAVIFRSWRGVGLAMLPHTDSINQFPCWIRPAGEFFIPIFQAVRGPLQGVLWQSDTGIPLARSPFLGPPRG